jgi:uncharacterized membrane protein YeaQ/YmgE (transglycosylase-associated protein family)
MLHILWSIVIGFVVGLIARALVPGSHAMGFWMTSGLGIAGSTPADSWLVCSAGLRMARSSIERASFCRLPAPSGCS